MVASLYKQVFGNTISRQCFLAAGVILQIIIYIAVPETSLISLFSGITGIFAVVLCAERKLIYYAFAWPQLISYVYLAYQQKLYGEIYENIFYAVTMIIGMFVWFRHFNKLKDNNYEVTPKHLSKKVFWIINIIMIISIFILWRYLAQTDDSQPLLDSITTVPAFIAQILLTFRYREQWIYWLIIDITSIFMWAAAADYCMVSQYIFWTANCILGYKVWSNKDN